MSSIIHMGLGFCACVGLFVATPAQGPAGKAGGKGGAASQPVQAADPAFETKVANPAYDKDGPVVLFDEAHNNFHTSDGRYKPFVDLLTSDGYRFRPNTSKFAADALKGAKVLVIANASGKGGPAFTVEECKAVGKWVRAGGSLLLIADHAPFGAAAAPLAMEFGVEMSGGYTSDPTANAHEGGNANQLVFSMENKLLGDHAILRGRNKRERIRRVVTFTGQSLKCEAKGDGLLKLSDTAVDRPGRRGSASTVKSAKGRVQAVAITQGKGRVVVLGEAACLTAQIQPLPGADPMRFGMNVPGSDNRQFALNLMHWLSGLIQ